MPKYFFNVEGGPDEIGVDLPSLSDARVEAVRYLGDVLREGPAAFWGAGDLHMWVTDEKGLMLFALRVITTDAPSILVIPTATT